MTDLLERLCNTDATSGDEGAVRELIIREIDGYCDWKIDRIGNIIAYKKGKKESHAKLMLDAHMDEVGLIITGISKDGFLDFKTVGGIDTAVLMFRQVRINGSVPGVIGGKPIHLLSKEEGKKLPDPESLCVDIGARTREEALALVKIGDRAVISGEFVRLGDQYLSKALDDRVGCSTLISLLREESEYGFYAVFSTQEEIGLRGARCAAFGIDPRFAIVLEATTAADIADVPEESRVCALGKGPAVSFMDRATAYDRVLARAALDSGLPCQPKCAVAGGNNAGSIHLTREGIRTLALSVPCRYIHSPSCVANASDCDNLLALARYMKDGICSGKIV